MSSSTLSEIVESWGGLIQTGPFGSQLHQHDYSEQGIPVVMPKDIRNGRVDENGIARIPEGKASQLSRHFLKAGSVVFPRRGEISKCAYIDEEQAGFLCGTGCIKIEPPEEKLRSKFLFYFLGLRQSVEWLERNAVGTTMLNLNTKILGGLKVPLFAPKKQDEIVEILSAYDDLIENNRRRIQLLEQAARLLYKEWFVHLRFPGHEHTPIIDGLPEGWERHTLEKLCEDVSYGYTTSAIEYNVGPKFLRITDIVPEMIDWERVPHCEVDERKLQKFLLREGDVVVARTGATVGYAKRIGAKAPVSVFASYLVRFRFGEKFDNILGGIFMESDAYKAYVQSNIGGAAQPNANARILGSVKVLVPTRSLQGLFRDNVAPISNQRNILQAQNQQLAQARDLLLPKLMNGEIVA